MEKKLVKAINKHGKNAILLLESPAESYLQANASVVKKLIEQGFEGIYVSFQRPFDNLCTRLKGEQIDTSKIQFIDVATSLAKVQITSEDQCTYASEDMEVDDIVSMIHTKINDLTSHSNFVYIDSLTTITLHLELSETLRFSDFLIQTVKKCSHRKISLIVNVAKDLRNKNFIKEIAFRADEVIAAHNE